MFQENLEKSIGLLLKENGHELVVKDADCIFYVKKIGDGLAFHVRCFHYDKYQSSVRIALFFTAEDVSYEDITTSTVGLQIPLITTGPEVRFDRELRKFFVVNDIFANDDIIAAGRKILAIEEALGADARKVIWEEAHV